MTTLLTRPVAGLIALALLLTAALAPRAEAESGPGIEAKVDLALQRLVATQPGAADLLEKAAGYLLMPDVTKAGLLLGGAYGEGALRVNNATVAYYSVVNASVGLQIGVQQTSHIIFFMTTEALEQFRRADGWELGADAEFTVPEDGLHGRLNSTTAQRQVIAIVFAQDGAMVGVSLAGGKYSQIIR